MCINIIFSTLQNSYRSVTIVYSHDRFICASHSVIIQHLWMPLMTTSEVIPVPLSCLSSVVDVQRLISLWLKSAIIGMFPRFVKEEEVAIMCAVYMYDVG